MFLIGGRQSTRLVRSLEQGWTEYLHASHSTRGVEAFFKKTAIAYCGDPSKKAKLGWYAIAVFFKNASTPRVQYALPPWHYRYHPNTHPSQPPCRSFPRSEHHNSGSNNHGQKQPPKPVTHGQCHPLALASPDAGVIPSPLSSFHQPPPPHATFLAPFHNST